MLAPPPSFSNDSIGEIAEQVIQFSFYRKQIAKNQQIKKRIDINISELLNMEVLDKIRQTFLKNKDENGQESLPAHEFIEVLSQYLPRSEIERIYQKIDVNDDGNVDWQEFTGFLTTSNSNDNNSTKIYNKIFTLKLEQQFDDLNHKDMIDFICFSSKPIPVLATAGRDGQILIWNQSDLRRIGSIIHHDKNEVFVSNMMSKLSIHQKAMVAKSATVNPITTGKKNVLITSLTMMPLSGHVCVSSGDCCVSLYDLSTQEICGRITSLTQIPTTLESFVIIDKIKEICNQYLVIGDSKGHIFILQFDSEFGMSVDAGSKKKNQILMNEAVQRMQTAKPHQDWISSMIYVPDLSRLVIGSMDGTVSLFNNQNLHVDRVFHGHKVGVRCVAWCNSNKFLLSAGTDRVILIWDPYTLRINVTIDGLSGLIISLTVNDRFHEIIAVLEDKTIRTWDAVTFEPISTIIDTSIQLPTNIITSALFVPSLNSLYTAGSRISCWQLDRATETLTNSTDDDLLSVLYNPVFNLILIITKSGVVNTFKLIDGSVIIKFSIVTESTKLPIVPKIDEKSGQVLPLVTNAVFDYSYRRLIIITRDSTEIQIWNFHNGQCLKIIHPRLPSSLYQIPHHALPTYKPYSLTNILYQHIYYGPLRLPKKYIVVGTDIGVTSCLLEMGDDIEEEPIYNLILPDRTGKRYETILHNNNNNANSNNNVNANNNVNNANNNNSTNSSNEIKFAKSIDWIIPSSENKVLIRYKNMDVVQWDLEKSTAGVELCRRANELGESFIALRRRVIAPRSKSILVHQEKLNVDTQDSDSDDDNNNNNNNNNNNLPNIQETMSPPDSPDDNRSNRSNAPILNLPNSKKVAIKSNGKRTTGLQDTKGIVPSSSLSSSSSSNQNQNYYYNQHQRGSVLRSSFSLRNSRIVKPSMVQNFMSPVNEDGSPIIVRETVAPAAVVGVARSTFRRATLNPLEEANESSLTDFSSSQSITRSSFPRRSTRVSLLQPNRPAEPRLTESIHLDSSIVSELQPEVTDENEETHQTSHIEKTVTTNSSVKTLNSDLSSTRNAMIRINAVVVLKMSKVAIGSCSDDLIRLWDLENGRVMCSCPSLSNQIIPTDIAESQNQLTCLCTNDKQDILVGGYETGEVKVWLISNPSILNLKNSQQHDGLSVPPLQLLAEWTAHVAATFTVECITLDEEDWGAHETYLVTSGHDQESHLWTTSGLLVGTFGVSSWDLNLKNTWKMKPSDTTHASQESSKIVQNAAPPPPHSPRKSKQKTPRHNQYQLTPSTSALEDHQRAVRLQLHMEKITEKHSKPHVSVTSVHDEVFSESTIRHPIVDVTKKGYISKKLKAAITQNSYMINPIMPLQRDK